MSLSDFFRLIKIGQHISGHIQGENTLNGQLETVDISGKVTEISHYTDMHICEIDRTKYKIIWTPNPQPPIERIAQHSKDTIVRQIAAQVKIQTWVDGGNRGPDEWKTIYTLYIWQDASFPDADKTDGFSPEAP